MKSTKKDEVKDKKEDVPAMDDLTRLRLAALESLRQSEEKRKLAEQNATK